MRTPDWLTRSGLDDLSKRAAAAPRRRLNRNLHVMDDPVHRLFNAVEPEAGSARTATSTRPGARP